MLEQIQKLGMGALGVSATEITPTLLNVDMAQANSITANILQIIIAIATLFSLFKKKKSTPIE